MKRLLISILFTSSWFCTSTDQVLVTMDPVYRHLRSVLKDIEWSRHEDMSPENTKHLIKELNFYSTFLDSYVDLSVKADSMLSYYKFQYTWR